MPKKPKMRVHVRKPSIKAFSPVKFPRHVKITPPQTSRTKSKKKKPKALTQREKTKKDVSRNDEIKEITKESAIENDTDAILCDNCDKKDALLYCVECKDNICKVCNEETHKSKKKKVHQRINLVPACDNCDERAAVMHCAETSCGLLCKDCDKETHKSKKKRLHSRKPLYKPIPQCENCDQERAVFYCVECTDNICQTCDQETHKSKKKKNHSRTKIKKQLAFQIEGFPSKGETSEHVSENNIRKEVKVSSSKKSTNTEGKKKR